MRSNVQRMLYSPERSSLAGKAPTGSVLSRIILSKIIFFRKIFPAGVRHTGKRHTFYRVKDENRSSMRRGHRSITRLSAVFLRALPLPLLCLAAFGSLPAQAQSANQTAKETSKSAKSWYKAGQAAELHKDYDTAFADYQHAVNLRPKDLRYKADFARMRFQAAAAHVDRGRVLIQSGDLNGALVQFQRALEIDPSYQAAQQEIDQLQKQISATPPGGPPAPTEQASRMDETLASISSISGPVELKPLSNEPIPAIHMVEDVKVIYQAIGKAAGFNVLFDPDYTSKRIPVDLNNVSWSDALRIVGTLAGTFYKPVTSNTIFVAANTRTKRTDLDAQAVQTFYLTNASQPNDANELVVAIRNLLDPSVKIYVVPSQNAIVMRATPDELLIAQKLLNDLDRARPEVVVDVAVLEVNKDRLRNLGITLPQTASVSVQATTTTSTGSTPTTGGGTTTPPTLNQLAHLNANNVAVSIGPATANALLTDVDTRILQNPSIRATDGQRATMKIGQKIPIATGSYNAGVSTGVASIGVQTQFTYIDVGVNIDITPTIHFDREVTLKLKIEVLSQAGQVTISGVTEPIIGQRSTEQVIQLQDGEPSLLAGIITTQDSLNINGTPGLGEIPFFKYFFSSRSKEVLKDEIVFLLIPHIVRESVLTRMNTRAIDTGTGQSIELRRNAAVSESANEAINPIAKPRTGQATSAANAAAAMAQQLSQQAQPLTPPAVNQPANQPADQQQPGAPAPAAVPAGPPISFTVSPPASNQTVGSTFQVAVMLNNARDLFSVPLQVKFNPAVLQLVNVDSGDLLSRDGQLASLVHREDNGLVAISTTRPPNTAGVSGQGSLCTLTFKAVAAGDSDLTLVKVGAVNSKQANLPAVGSQAVVHVK
jgi:general secretion pathway protein D